MKSIFKIVKKNAAKRLQAGVLAFCLMMAGAGVASAAAVPEGDDQEEIEISAAEWYSAHGVVPIDFEQLFQDVLAPSVGTYASDSGTFTWNNIQPNYIRQTSVFYAKSGHYINTVAIASSSTALVRVGIITPTAVHRCVQGTGGAAHSFYLDRTGYYRVFVENLSTQTLSYITGNYTVSN